MPVQVFTDSARKSPGPGCSVPALVNRIYAVLRKSVCFRVGSGSYDSISVLQTGQAGVLPTNPYLVIQSADRIDHIAVQRSGCNALNSAFFKEVQSAACRTKPNAILIIYVNRSIAF